MGDFFKGWRRKVGVVTLIVACVFMGGWICALQDIRDIAVFPSGKHTFEQFVSGESSISWIRIYDEDVIRTTPEFKRIDFSDDPSWHNGAFLDPRIEWDLHWCGFGAGRIGGPPDRNWLKVCWVIPYWSVVVPLTLISFWLLLFKPHKSTLKKLSEPISNDGT